MVADVENDVYGEFAVPGEHEPVSVLVLVQRSESLIRGEVFAAIVRLDDWLPQL
jgi:hypothetical protein